MFSELRSIIKSVLTLRSFFSFGNEKSFLFRSLQRSNKNIFSFRFDSQIFLLADS